MPVVYSTAYYALMVRGRMQPGETVLIHSGSGGVGQAAIAIALSLGCRVFTTVGKPLTLPRAQDCLPGSAAKAQTHQVCLSLPGSAEKRAYLQSKFPQLNETSFANSRDTSFEQHVLWHTAGKGRLWSVCWGPTFSYAKSLQSCPTRCHPADCSPPGSSMHGDSSGRKTGAGCRFLLQGIQ